MQLPLIMVHNRNFWLLIQSNERALPVHKILLQLTTEIIVRRRKVNATKMNNPHGREHSDARRNQRHIPLRIWLT